MKTKKLSDMAIKSATARDKAYKLADGGGLYLEVLPSGTKSFRMKMRVDGKEKRLVFGTYPRITLSEARALTLQAKAKLSMGIDPSQEKQEIIQANKQKRQVMELAEGETLEAIAREWFDRFKNEWVDGHASKIIRRMERDLFPILGKRGIDKIKPIDLLAALRKVEARGALETAHRLLQNCGQVWRYATATGRVERDITGDLRGALPPARQTHLGAVTEPREIGALLRNIDEYIGSEVVRMALRIAPHVFVRPGELRQAQRLEFDLKNKLWTIPAGRMKAKRPHVVPLSTQVSDMLTDLFNSHSSAYLFPSPRASTRCLSDVALLAALRRMGYTKEEMTAHGFRALASTNLEQLGYDSRLIEIQLAHADQDSTRAAYKRETHLLRLDERREMMQKWSNYLDELAQGAQVLELKRA